MWLKRDVTIWYNEVIKTVEEIKDKSQGTKK